MNNQELRGVFYPSEDGNNRLPGWRDAIRYGAPLVSDQLSVWFQNAPNLSSISAEDQDQNAACYYNMLNDLQNFEAHTSLSSQQKIPAEIPYLGNIVQHNFDEGESTGTKKKWVSDPGLKMQTKEITAETEDDPKTSYKRKQPRRTCPAAVHKLYQRLRRQKLREKMKSLQQIIPNCNKRDNVSTLDDAIKYIKNLQCQLQLMTSMGSAYYTMLHSMSTRIPQQGHQGFQIPCLAPFLQTNRTNYEIETRTSSMLSPINFPILNSTSSSSMNDASLCTNQTGDETHEGSSNKNEFCPIILVKNEKSCTRREESSARVLPTLIVPSQVTNSAGSTKWSCK